MKKSMKQRVALFLSFAMAFTSVDSSALVAAADVTESVSEEIQQEDTVSEEAQEEAAVQEEEALQEEMPAEEELLEETENAEEESSDGSVSEETDDEMDAISQTEEDGVEEQLIGEDLYEVEAETADPDGDSENNEDGEAFPDTISATPLQLEQSYTVSLDVGKTCEWFSYTAQEETTVVFRSNSENNIWVDNYVEVYDAKGKQVVSDDESAGYGQFSIKVTVPAGTTYYFKTRMFSEGNEGTFQVFLRQTVGIKAITGIETSEDAVTTVIAGVSNNLAYGTKYTIEYENGTSKPYTIDSYQKQDEYGNTIAYQLKQEDGSTASYGSAVSAGKYALSFVVDEEEIESTDYIYEAIDVEKANLPKLTSGNNTITNGGKDYNWYQFDATEGVKYYIANAKKLSVYTKDENGQMNWVTISGGLFQATKTGAYYIGFQSYDNEEKEITVNVSEVLEISTIKDIVIPEDAVTTIISGVQSMLRLGYGTEYTIQYTDDTEKDMQVGSDNRDDYGNYIEYRFKPAGITSATYSNTYSYNDTEIPTGTYALSFFLDGKEIASTDAVYESIDAESAGLPELTSGENTITNGGKDYNWYQFNATEGVKYHIANAENLTVYTKSEDGNMTYVPRDAGSFKAAKTGVYYIGFKSYSDEEKEMSVNVLEVVDIAEIKDIEISEDTVKTVILGVQYNLGYGTQYTIQYTDKSERPITVNNSGYWDVYGNYIEYRFKPAGITSATYSNTYDCYSAKMPEGTYALSFFLNGKEIASTDAVYESIDLESAGLPELTEGVNTIESGRNWNREIWYRFQAPKTSRYMIDKYSGVSVYTKEDGEMTQVSSNGGFQATKDSVYYLGFYGCIWDGEQDVYEWTMNLTAVPNITSITVDTCETTSTIAGLQTNMGDGSQYTIHYSDGTTDQKTVDSYSYTDKYSNYIFYYFIPEKQEDDDDDRSYDWSDSKPAGSYALAFYVNGTEQCRTDYVFESVDADAIEFSALNEGENTIKSGRNRNNTIWYRFQAPKTSRYMIDKYSGVSVYTKEDGEMTQVSSNGGFQATKDSVYYLGFYGSIWDGEQEQDVYEWTMNLTAVPDITSITVDTCETTSIISGLQTNMGDGSQYTIHYADGTTEQKTVDDYRYTDNYSNDIFYRFIPKQQKEDDEDTWYNWGQSKPEGNYALAFYVNGKKQYKTEYVFESVDADKANLVDLTEGGNTIKSGRSWNRAIWYRFQASKTSRYVMDRFDDVSVYTEEDDGMTEVSSNGVFQAEKDRTYYLGFYGSIWDGEQEQDVYEWTMNLTAVPDITSITVDTCETTSIISGLQTNMGYGSKYTMQYSDGNTVKETVDSYSYTDDYRNEIFYRFIPEQQEEDNNTWYSWGERKPEGTYALAFYVNGKEQYRTGYIFKSVRADQASLPELKVGKNKIQSGTRDYNWYRFTAEETGTYRFDRYSEEFAVYHDTAEGMESLSTSRGAFAAKAKESYYIGFGGECELEEDVYAYTWEAQLSKIKSVKSISLTPKKTSFYESIEQNHALFSLQFTYEDGTSFTCEDWENNSYDIDGKGNGINVYIIDKVENEEEEYNTYRYDRELSAGDYIVCVESETDSSVSARYPITIEEEPTPFNKQADVTEVTLENSYPVEVNADRTAQWFKITPDRDMEVICQSDGNYDTYVHFYSESGEELDTNDDGGQDRNFKLTASLKAGETYYFKTRLYTIGAEGNFSVSFHEKLQIQTLTVLDNDLKEEYLKNEHIPTPSVLVKATYNKEGVSETFYRGEKDSFGNRITGEVQDSNGKVVKSLKEEGTYTYWVRNGNVTAKVGTFIVKSVQDVVENEVPEDAEQQIDAKDQRMSYRFTITEAAIYQMTANVPFKNLKVYNNAEEKIELSGVQSGYSAYAALEPGDYYVVAGVSKEITKLRVKIQKTVLPQKATVVFDGSTLIAGIDSLSADNLSTQVDYTDSTTAWIDGEGSDSYGNRYTYDIDRGQEDEYWEVGETLWTGTYTVKPVVFRTGAYITADTSDNQMLKKTLKDENLTAATVQVVKPSLDDMTPIQENQWVQVSGNARRYFYTFTPTEDGTYRFEYDQDTSSSNSFYRNNAQYFSRMGERRRLSAGETYVVLANRYENYEFKIVKYEKSTSETVTKKVQSIQLYSDLPYVLSYNIYAKLSMKVTYADGTTEILGVPQAEETHYDEYGNSYSCNKAPEIMQEQNGTYIQFAIVCNEKEVTLKLPYFTLEEKAIEVAVDKPANNTAERYFKITPQESGEYIFRVTAKEWGAQIHGFYKESIRNSFSYEEGNDKIWQTAKTLKKGKTYYFEMSNYGENLTYTVSVLKPKNVTDLKITGYAKDYKVYEGTNGIGNAGIKAQVTYEDGTTENLDGWKVSETGRVLNISRAFWVNTKTYRIVVKFGEYSAYVDIPASDMAYKAELKEDVPVTGSGNAVAYSFTPSESGVYQFKVQGNGWLDIAVYNSGMSKEIESYNSTYELLKNVKYNVLVYRNDSSDAEFQVTVGREKPHTHTYVETVIKNATCENTGYKQMVCSICGKVKPESGVDIPATGHNWQDIVDKAATCAAAGSHHKECTVCHKKEAAISIPATGAHKFGTWTTTTAATALKEGVKTRICSVCKKTETQIIPKLQATIRVTATQVTVKTGDSLDLSKYVTGLALGDSVASYTSSNSKVASVNSAGKVTGIAAGTVKITIGLASKGKTAEITVVVQKKQIATKSIKGLSKTLKLKVKATKQLKPVITPANRTDKLTYATSDKKIVTVSAKGKVTAKKAGKAKITVQSGKKKFVITVTVTAPTPTGMKNVPGSVNLKKGKTYILKPMLLPSGATGKITYKTSNKKVATVDATGKITAKKKGTANITVTVGKIKKTCKVTVK